MEGPLSSAHPNWVACDQKMFPFLPVGHHLVLPRWVFFRKMYHANIITDFYGETEQLHALPASSSEAISLWSQNFFEGYRKIASRSTCYYSENQVFGSATNRDMSLNETCYYSKIQKFWTLKGTYLHGYLSKSFFTWISNPSLLGFQISLCLDFKSFFAWISYASLLGLVVNLGEP